MASVATTEQGTGPVVGEERSTFRQKDDVPGGGEGRGSQAQQQQPKEAEDEQQQAIVIVGSSGPITATTIISTTDTKCLEPAIAAATLPSQQQQAQPQQQQACSSPPITPSRAAGQVPIQSIPIETKCGIITAHVQGDLEQMENRGVFLTVHDIGSNSRSFLDFTEHPIMNAIKLRSLFIHVDLIGQQDNQQDLPDDFEFPPIKKIGEELLVEVLDKLKIKLIVGIGEGAGANILVRFATKYHSRVLGLVLIHLAPAGVGVLERLKSQIGTGKRRFSEFSAENIVELHRLGDSSGRSGQSSPPPQSEQQQLMPLYANRVNNMNAKNIKRYAISYMNRKELPLLKDMDILLVAGSRSPYLNGTQKYFAQCDKEKTSFLKVDHVVDVLTEAPEKLAKSILLFVKGLGFLTSLTLPGIDRQRTLSGSSQGSNEESGATMGPVPNIKPHRMLERRRTLSMEEYDMPRPRRLISAQSFQSSTLGRSASHQPVKPSPLATKTN